MMDGKDQWNTALVIPQGPLGSARMQHYGFTHILLREAFLGDPKGFSRAFESEAGNTRLRKMWEQAGQRVAPSDRIGPEGLSFAMTTLGGGFLDTVLVKLPQPTGVTEAFFAALVIPQDRPDAGPLFYTLELGQSDEGQPTTLLCQWETGTHGILAKGIAPSPDAFKEALRQYGPFRATVQGHDTPSRPRLQPATPQAGKTKQDSRFWIFSSVGCGTFGALLTAAILIVSSDAAPLTVVKRSLIAAVIFALLGLKWAYGGSARDRREEGLSPHERTLLAGRGKFLSMMILVGLMAATGIPSLLHVLRISMVSKDLAGVLSVAFFILLFIAVVKGVADAREINSYLMTTRRIRRVLGIGLMVLGFAGIASVARFGPDMMKTGRPGRRNPAVAVAFLAAISAGAALGGGRLAFGRQTGREE